ncbi:hypothetical protein ABZR88_18790 [Mucilaginibacter yixingensis]|nr:hypothetical protein [Mucilaginibacter yixingensis]
MKTTIKPFLVVIICALFFSSCAALRLPDLTKLSIGMDKATVYANMGKKPDAVIGARKYPNGNIEVVSYAMGFAPGVNNTNLTYKWLYFYNDKLYLISGPGDWQHEADLLVADNDITPEAVPAHDGAGTRGGK